MIVDNSFRLFANKTGLIWRVLLYQLVCIVVLCGLAVACCYSLFMELSANGFLTQLSEFFTNNLFNFRVDQTLSDINVLVYSFSDILSANMGQLLPLTILLVAIFGVLGSFLFRLVDLPITECIYGHMGSCAKLNFMGCFIANLSRSVRYSLCRLITTVPIDLAIVTAFFASLGLFGLTGVVKTMAPFLVILILFVLITFRQSLFCVWQASIVANNNKIWKAFRENFRIVTKNYKIALGTSVLCVLLAFAINYGLSVLTCGVSLFVTIPATLIFLAIVYNVIYFHTTGLRYYIDKDRIITPKKLEDQERLSDIKNLI